MAKPAANHLRSEAAEADIEADAELIEEAKVEPINQTGMSNLIAGKDDRFLIGDPISENVFRPLDQNKITSRSEFRDQEIIVFETDYENFPLEKINNTPKFRRLRSVRSA